MELPSGCWSIALVLVLFLSTNGGYCNKAVSPQSDEDFAFEFTGDEDLIVEVTSNSIVSPIRKLWGIDDLTTCVNKLFRFIPPSDTFTMGVNYYELKNANGKEVPNWIVFNKLDGSISGVPLHTDAQQVSLILYAYRNSHDYASDEFKINIKYNDDYINGINCGKRNRTVLSIILNEAAKDIKPKQRLQTLENLAQFWGLDSSAFRIAGQFKNEHTTIEENSIILAGPGDKKVSSKLHGAIQLVIGCDGKIDQQFPSILAKLKEQARDGTISEVTGLSVVGWRVAKEINSIRRRRDATTPEGGLALSYYDENIDDDEDSDDLDEGSTEVPPPAIIPPVTEETPELEQSTHPHRHHHQILPFDTEEQPYPKITPIEETIDVITTPVASTIKSTTVQSTPEVTSTRTSTAATADNDNTEENDLTKQSSAIDTNKRKPEPPLEEDDLYDEDDDDEDVYDEETTEVPTTQTTSTTATNVGANVFTQSSVINTEPTVPETTKIPIVPTTIPTTQSTTEEEIITSQSTTPLYSTSILSSSNPTVQSTVPSTESSSISASTTLPPSSPSSSSTTYSLSSLPTFAPTTSPEESTPAVTTAAQTTEDESTIATVPRTVFDPPKNAPPIIKHRLKKIAWTAGKIHRYVIPNDTFGDPDGDTLILRLLDSNGAPIKDNSWIQFNDKTNEIYGLPLEKDVSKWHFTVQAEDAEGGIVSDELEVNVQHHKSKRTQTHEFTMKLRIEDKYDLPKPLDWQIRVLKGLMEVYKNEDLSHIRVRNVDIHSEPVTFSWSNISLPTDYCPKNDINSLMNVLVSDNEGTPSLALQNALAPEIRVKHVHVKGLEQCDGLLTSQRNVSKNTRPMPRNQIDHINATVGELLVFRVPADTFYDAEDGNTLKLKLSLLTMDRQTIPSSHWLQFDEKNKEFYGIPHASDKGRHEYQLICQDSGGLTATDGLVVSVNQQPSRLNNPSVHFSMKIRQSFESFDKNPRLKRKFVEKLAEIFNDKDTSHIVIESITDSTVVTWLNRSLHTIVCPNDDISRLRQFLINNDESITDRVTKVMNSDFNVESVSVRPSGICLGGSTVYHPDIPIPVPDDSRQTPSRSDDYLITIVLPGVIILTMLLLAGIVACVLIRRRRRSGKLNVGDEERRSLRTKGIPVIFQDELDDKPEPGNKTPIIMKEEKPPLPPPEYSKRGDSPEEEALYQPPPPFPANRDSGRSARPKATPTYRKPPPYVPP